MLDFTLSFFFSLVSRTALPVKVKIMEKWEFPAEQKQVFIEVLVADLTIDDTRQLGAMLRNPAKIPLPGEVEFQSAHLSPGIIPDNFSDPSTVSVIDNSTDCPEIASDLLRNSIDSSGSKSDSGDRSAASLLEAGSTAIALADNDGKVWSLLQILKTFEHTKILSHPHIIAVHNQKATIEVGETRLVAGEATTSSLNPIRKNETIEAKLKINITPKISTADSINVQVEIDIDEFLEAGDARATRQVITNANIANKGVLALGGLIRSNTQKSLEKTPLLGNIPILGHFFKRRKGTLRKNNLTVFISPTIIEPRLREGASQYTRDYINLAHDYVSEGDLFDSLRDPITRWYFKTGTDANDIVNDFVKKDVSALDGIAHNSVKVPARRTKNKAQKPETKPELKASAKPTDNVLTATTTQKPAPNISEPVCIAFDKKRHAQELKAKVMGDTNPFNPNQETAHSKEIILS